MNKATRHLRLPSRQTLRALVRDAETGAGAITFQVIGYVNLLVILLALVYDFGGVIFAQQVLKSAVVVASQELAKDVDANVFNGDQEVRLVWRSCGELQPMAQAVANRVTGGSGTLRAPNVTITSACMEARSHSDAVIVRGSVNARVPILNLLLGVPPFTINAEAVAMPNFGINTLEQM